MIIFTIANLRKIAPLQNQQILQTLFSNIDKPKILLPELRVKCSALEIRHTNENLLDTLVIARGVNYLDARSFINLSR